jgi:DNA polymerase III delta subunit
MGPTQFIAALRKNQPAAAYFLRGPDRFLHEECRKAIVASLPVESREWCLAEIEFEPKRLRQGLLAAAQMPMLGGHSFLIFSDPEDFKHATDDDYAALEEYFARPSPFATIVFDATEPDRRRRFVQFLEKNAEIVEMLPLTRREAASWLEHYLGRAGVEISPELAEDVAARFESSGEGRPAKESGVNLLWMRTEIEKALAAKPQAKRLERADLDLLVVFREEHEIGKLLRAIAQRQLPSAYDNLRALLASKQSEMLILWLIGDLFRQALRSGAGSAYGYAGARYGARNSGWNRNPFSTQELAPVARGKYSHRELLQALRHVRQADLGIKSSWKDSRLLLEFLVWQIIVGKSAGSAPPITEGVPVSASEA